MSELLSKTEILQIAQVFLGSTKSHFMSFNITKRTDTAAAHFGDHLVLELVYKLGNDDVSEYFFVKTFPTQCVMGEDFLRKTDLFQREVGFYKILFNDMKKVTGTQDWCPKYYYSNDETLVLEDLSTQNFQLCSEQLLFDRNHLELALTVLSTMHATSILLEEKLKRPLDEAYPALFSEIIYDDEDGVHAPYKRLMKKGIRDLLARIDLLEKYSEGQKMIIKEKLPAVLWSIYPLNKKSSRYKNVLIHNDLWKNNILFKYENGKPIDCKLVDYQFSRYLPPAHDVMCLLHLTTTKSFRDEQEKSLLEFYHEQLENHLASKNFLVQDFIPWRRFEETCKRYKMVALIQGTLNMHFLLGSADQDTENVLASASKEEYDEYVEKHRKEYVMQFFRNPLYKNTVPDMFTELIDEFVLKETDGEKFEHLLARF